MKIFIFWALLLLLSHIAPGKADMTISCIDYYDRQCDPSGIPDSDAIKYCFYDAQAVGIPKCRLKACSEIESDSLACQYGNGASSHCSSG